jgi:hypothetical protein
MDPRRASRWSAVQRPFEGRVDLATEQHEPRFLHRRRRVPYGADRDFAA